jgi:hypothetical protein
LKNYPLSAKHLIGQRFANLGVIGIQLSDMKTIEYLTIRNKKILTKILIKYNFGLISSLKSYINLKYLIIILNGNFLDEEIGEYKFHFSG